MKTYSYKEINKIPCLTWNWLKMNRASFEVESDENICSDVAVENQTDTFLDIKGEKTEITATKSGESVLLHFDFADGRTYSHEQTITAQENSEITVVMDYTSGACDSGFSTIKTHLIAKPYSKIHLIKVQLLGEKYVQIDDTDAVCEDGALIDVTQIELGGSKTFAQVITDLNGYQAKFHSDTAFIAKDSQVLDMNYLVNHFGQKTDTKMNVKGVVDGNAVKTYRGTIDFKNGCAGSTGDEQEETLLMSPTAINKSIPMILCDEEDVAGTHGATLGRLSAEELFYMNSRGISEKEAKKMMSKAKIISVANLIPDESLKQKIFAFIGEE
ncbi:MAG: SufD family Fe-S cluster assembly protein [Treponema sp.]|nr:SufD family Fe-S cluster assembly protein [Candidatus Treponema equifaecale]